MRSTLRKTREDKRLTQDAVAEKVGINRVYYVQIEAGQRNPSAKVMFRIAEVLDADPRVLFADLAEKREEVAP